MDKTLSTKRQKALISFLIQERERAGLTQAGLASRIGEYQSFVARMESGQRRIDVIEFIELSRILGFDPGKAVQRLEKQFGSG